MRLMIGWVQMFDTPGSVVAASISPMSFSRVIPGRHSASGLRFTIVSVILTGAGSVEVSAREIFATTDATSGNFWIASFCFFTIAMACGSEIDGSRDRHEHQVPLVERGHELFAEAWNQDQGARHHDQGKPEREDVDAAGRGASMGRYAHTSGRIMGLLSSPRIFPPINRLHSTGTSVTESSVAPTIENVFVNASGWKSFPSCPVSAKTGMNARMMIAIEKKIGRPTRRVASSTVSVTRRRFRGLIVALLHEAEGVLGDDDRRVHEHADGDRDARQRHDVRGDIEVPHEEERGQDGDGKRDGHDEDRAEVEQKDDVDDRHDDGLFNERPLQRMHGALNQARAIVEGDDRDARREARLAGP